MPPKETSIAAALGTILGAIGVLLTIWEFVDRVFSLGDFLPMWVATIVLPVLAFATVSFFGFHFYRRCQTLVKRLPSTITLFLPLDNAGPDSKRDGMCQLHGVTQLISRECKLTEQVHLKIFDSSLPRVRNDVELSQAEIETLRSQQADMLMSHVRMEYSAGCRYFFCTMSQVLESFAPKFRDWSLALNAKGRPSLLATVAAADLPLDRACVFRYYPRSQDEATPIVDRLRREGMDHAIVVRIKSRFGRDFEEKFGRLCDQNAIHCSSVPSVEGRQSVDNIRQEIEAGITRLHAATSGCCLILVLYGESLGKTIEAINGIHTPLRIFSVSTMTTELSAGRKLSATHRWFLCEPRMRGNLSRRFQQDIIAFYVFEALRRYATCIQMCRNDRTVDFPGLWTSRLPELQTKEEVEWQVVGDAVDSKIAMEVREHRQ